ncbi:hypothetical protein AVEN_134519-1 [Araneus ventricosus]|uniref:MBD domain-containing protein n=1 Tax=Araneus ventricosus TaxID=182803 RepID=A0A4Y2J3R9_ARAVE|nr:hypothetical protein AVEN_134519-1 [Araneus ventricosus]
MNSVVERYKRTIIEGVRALLHESKLPKNLGAEFVNTQNYLRNRFPHKALKGKAPLIVWSDKKFSVRHFQRIGCVAYIFMPKRYRNKLETNAQKDFEFSSNETSIPKPSDKTEYDWKRVCVTRQKGKTKGRIDAYYYPEAKVRLRSNNEVKKCCESKGIDYNPDKFYFSPKLILNDNEPNAIGTQSDEFSTDVEDIPDSEAHLVDIKIPNNFKESQNVSERENCCIATKEEI